MATKRNSTYWAERFLALENETTKYSQDMYNRIEVMFSKAQIELQKDIDVWYSRLAKNNNISLVEAKKLLTANELAEFRWTIDEYIKYGEDNEITQMWVKQLENASAKHHISRLEALKIQTQQHLEKVFGNELDYIDKIAKNVYTNRYYHTAYEIQKGINIGWNVTWIDENKLDKLIKKPWAADGKNFSDRIWQNKATMVNELHSELVKNCLLGKSPDKAIENMTKFVDKKFKNAKSQAGRLVMTEQAFFGSAAQKDVYAQLGVEEFEIVATLDFITSRVCQDMDGKHFPLKEFQIGSTAPPFHPNCRTTTAPYFNDELSIGNRIARDKDGKTYYVPSNMKYDEWKKSFVKNTKDFSLQKIEINDRINGMDITKEWTKKDKTGAVHKKLSYTIGGVDYVVDGKFVILNPSESERRVAEILSEQYGKLVELVPKVNYPLWIQTPDYLVDGIRYDLKSPIGSGKYLFKGLIAKKRKQADNFIIDISACPLSIKEIEQQIDSLYKSPQVGFLKIIVLIKDEKVFKVYSRK